MFSPRTRRRPKAISSRAPARAGHAHNSQPIAAANVTFNIRAPGAMTDHIGAAPVVVDKN